jgi:D-glycero-D-manno-heptose 1,7-bisphosphate phosphatase
MTALPKFILVIETQSSLDEKTNIELKKTWLSLLPHPANQQLEDCVVVDRLGLKKLKLDQQKYVLLVHHQNTPHYHLDLFFSQYREAQPLMGLHRSESLMDENFFPDLVSKKAELILKSKLSDYSDALQWSHLFFGSYADAIKSLRQRFELSFYAYHAGLENLREAPKNGALFLDRDGVLIEDGRYLYEPEKVVLKKGIVELIKRAKEKSYKVFCVTNQSGIARGFFNVEQMRLCHQKIDELLHEQGVSIDEWFYCPYHPEGEVAEFKKLSLLRKPLAGMLLQAAMKHPICFEKSLMIGDNLSDQLDLNNLRVYLTPGHYPLVGALHPILDDFQEISF